MPAGHGRPVIEYSLLAGYPTIRTCSEEQEALQAFRAATAFRWENQSQVLDELVWHEPTTLWPMFRQPLTFTGLWLDKKEKSIRGEQNTAAGMSQNSSSRDGG
jgi:hypothetical protein